MGGEETLSLPAVFFPLLLDVVIVVDDAVPSGPQAAALEQALRRAADNLAEPIGSSSFGIDIDVALVSAGNKAASVG